MVDAADAAAQLVDEHLARGIQGLDRMIPIGVPGLCEGCGYRMPRLVDGQCGFCRDGRLPPDDWEPPTFGNELPRENRIMPAKSIQLPADAVSAIDAIEALAASRELSLGRAAAELIDRAIAIPPADTAQSDALTLTPFQRAWFARGGSLESLFEELIIKAQTEDRSDELAAAVARADAAEAKLATLRAALG